MRRRRRGGRRRQRRRRRRVATGRRGRQRWRWQRGWGWRGLRRWWRQRHRRVRVGEGAGGVAAVTTTRGRRAVRARRRQGRRRRRRWWRRRWRRRRRGGRLAGALAVDHVLDVHVAALVRVLVHRRRCLCHEGVRGIRAERQRNHFGTLKVVPNRHRAVHWAAPAVHLLAVGCCAHHVLVGLVVVGVVDLDREVALPLLHRRRRHRRWRGRWRRRRGRRGSRRRRREAARRRGRQRWWRP